MFFIDLKIFNQSLYQQSNPNTNQRKIQDQTIFPIFPTIFICTSPLMCMFDRVWSNQHLQILFLLCFSFILSFYSSVFDIARLLKTCNVFALFFLYFIFLSHLSLLQTDLASFFGLNPTVPGFSPNLQSGSLNFSRFAKINHLFLLGHSRPTGGKA